MLDNKSRREILEAAKATDYQGSIMDLYDAARQGQDVMQMLQPMQVAQTPEQKQIGLREQHAMGNTQASMAFPDTPPNAEFNTVGMKVPINISKFDEQGHLVQSFKNVPPGIESLPTGPGKGTVIETPAYKKGGYKAKYQKGGFEKYYQSLPPEKRDTSQYNLRRAFELAPEEQLSKFANDPKAHLNTFYFNKEGVGEFMKSPDHPTTDKELDFYYSDADDAKKFRSTYNLVQDKSGYKYIPKYQTGSFKDGMRGMMKARIALENEFGNNPAIQRMIVPPDNPYQFKDGTTGTHLMGSYGDYAIPDIQDVNGKLDETGPRMDEAIRFDRPEDAIYFAEENYKDVAPAFNESIYPNKYQLGSFKDRLFPPKVQQMHNNLEPVNYGGMLDEVTITPYTQSELALQERMGNKATGGIEPVYPVFDALTGLGVTRAGAKKLGSSIASKANTTLSKATTPSLYKNIDNAVSGFQFTDDMARQAAKQPLALPEPATFYRGTTPDKFADIMNPISTAGDKFSKAENLRFFSPDKGMARRYMQEAGDQGMGVSARLNIQNPFNQGTNPKVLDNQYIQSLMDQGYDAVYTQGTKGPGLRDAYEIIPLDKNVIQNAQRVNNFRTGGRQVLYNKAYTKK